MRRKILLYIGISLAFSTLFFVAFFLMLPTAPIRHFIEKTIEQQFKQKQSAEILDLSISPLLNLQINNFKMTPRSREPLDPKLASVGGMFDGYYCAPSVGPEPFMIDRLFVKPNLFSLISRKPKAQFEIDLKEGKLNGSLQTKGPLYEILAKAENVSLNEFSLLSNLTQTQIYGNLNTDIRTVIEKNKLMEFFLGLDIENTVLCPKRIKLDMGGIPYIEVPFTIFGNIKGNIEIAGERLIIHQLTSDGPDIKFAVTGDVFLKSEKNREERIDVEMMILPSESWLEENSMSVIYQVCRKQADGSITLKLSGSMKRLKKDCGTPIPQAMTDTPPRPKTEPKLNEAIPKEAPIKAPTDEKAIPQEDKLLTPPTFQRPKRNANTPPPTRPTLVDRNDGRVDDPRQGRRRTDIDALRARDPKIDKRIEAIESQVGRDQGIKRERDRRKIGR